MSKPHTSAFYGTMSVSVGSSVSYVLVLVLIIRLLNE